METSGSCDLRLATRYALPNLSCRIAFTVELCNLLHFAGDTEDLMLLAVVAVTVGYGLRPEDLNEV